VDTLLTKNPCIDFCAFKEGVCRACGRTKAEKKRWKDLPKETRDSIWSRIMATHGTNKGKRGRALRARHTKLSGKVARQVREQMAESLNE